MIKKKEQQFGLQPNTYIDLNHKDNAKSILIIGNTANFFGFLNKNEDNVFEIDCNIHKIVPLNPRCYLSPKVFCNETDPVSKALVIS